ncbi:hypothetical protein [Iodobacter ciconiae]|uniref:PAS domain-containing protein n=1 Tax=Iodobacter ciconiae TaxID=2496266 RepID=A0A3S8ZW54_9NEIS|nr:hypothetical protein [Iodobacter ciconiae]AZN37689.1 hypothetical protein EJO50_15170 [Iodobacter ciconiae]
MQPRFFQRLMGKLTAFQLRATLLLVTGTLVLGVVLNTDHRLTLVPGLIVIFVLCLLIQRWQLKDLLQTLKAQQALMGEQNERLNSAELAIGRACLEAEAAHQQLLEMSNVLPLVVFQMRVDPDGHCFYPFINQKVEEIFGISAESLKDDPELCWSDVHEDDRACAQNAIRDASRKIRAGCKAQLIELSIRLMGKKQPCQVLFRAVSSTLLPDAAVIWNGYYQDITGHSDARDEQ